MSSGHGDVLRRKIELASILLQEWSTRFWEHDRLPALVPEFLVAIHGSVRATIPLMRAAITGLERRGGDRLDLELADYLRQHADEEADHENWLLDDLASLGFDRDQVRARHGPPAIVALVGAQYYWIHHAHPVALLGFFAVLEGHPPTLSHLDQVERRTGLPASAFRMLRRHAELDVGHRDELYALIDSLPLEPAHTGLLGVSALHTIGALGELFRWLADLEAPASSIAPAAPGPGS